MYRTRFDIYHLAARLRGAPLISEEQLYLAALFQETLTSAKGGQLKLDDTFSL